MKKHMQIAIHRLFTEEVSVYKLRNVYIQAKRYVDNGNGVYFVGFLPPVKTNLQEIFLENL